MEHYSEIFVGIDVAKTRNAIAVAEGERGGEVQFLGEVDASGRKHAAPCASACGQTQSRSLLL